MFNPQKLILKKTKKYTLSYTSFANGMNSEVDDNLLPVKHAKLYYNYTVKNGALKTGLGFSVLKLPTEYKKNFAEREIWPLYDDKKIKKIWRFEFLHPDYNDIRHRILLATEDGQLLFFPSISPVGAIYYVFKPDDHFEGDMHAVNYKLNGENSLIIVMSKEGKFAIFQTGDYAYVLNDMPKLVSICLHYERLFAILEGERKTLMFSANLDPTNWNIELDGAGFIEMQDERGRLNKLISFNDYVYVFRDYGVSRVSAYGNQEEFSVSHLFVSSSKIYGNSVTACGDRIMFLARDGLHVFDGYNTRKLILNIESLFENVDNEDCCALFYNNKYYLACRLNYNDGEKVGCENYSEGYINNTLLEYDITTGDLNILRGVDIASMVAFEEKYYSKLVACFNGENANMLGQLDNSGKFFGKVLQKKWESPFSNFGHPNKQKKVEEILIKTKSDCKIKITSDKEEKTYFVKGKPTTQRVKTNVKGELLKLSFICEEDGDVEISSPQIVLGVV